MKTLIFALVLPLLLTTTTFAQNQIVVQSATGNPQFFYDFKSAVDAAIAGDRIYIPGGSFNLGTTLYINEKLEIIGAGYHSDSSLATGITRITGSDIYFRNGSDGSILTGIYLDGSIQFDEFPANSVVTISNIQISRCNVSQVTFGNFNKAGSIAQNIFVSECIIRAAVTGNATSTVTNFVLDNCIACSQISTFKNGCMFTNNVFPYDFAGNSILMDVDQSLVQNNVFYNTNIFYSSSTGNTFLNNLTTGTDGNIDWTANCIATGNIKVASKSDLLVNVTDKVYNEDFDYHLKEGSPGIGAGTDNTDIGLYGTPKPWKQGGIPFNPHFRLIDVDQYTDPNTGKFDVNMIITGQGN